MEQLAYRIIWYIVITSCQSAWSKSFFKGRKKSKWLFRRCITATMLKCAKKKHVTTFFATAKENYPWAFLLLKKLYWNMFIWSQYVGFDHHYTQCSPQIKVNWKGNHVMSGIFYKENKNSIYILPVSLWHHQFCQFVVCTTTMNLFLLMERLSFLVP